MVPLPFSCGSSTRCSDRLHDFSVTIPGCYKDVYVNSYFPHKARLWNSLPIECFPLTYELSGFKSRINRNLLTVDSLKRFPVWFNIFVPFFLVTPCLVVAVQPCMEWIPIKIYIYTNIYIYIYINIYIYIYILSDYSIHPEPEVLNHRSTKSYLLMSLFSLSIYLSIVGC